MTSQYQCLTPGETIQFLPTPVSWALHPIQMKLLTLIFLIPVFRYPGQPLTVYQSTTTHAKTTAVNILQLV